MVLAVFAAAKVITPRVLDFFRRESACLSQRRRNMHRARQPLYIVGQGLGKQTSILRGAYYATQLKFLLILYKFVMFEFLAEKAAN